MGGLTQLTPEQFTAFQAFIYSVSGIRIQDGKITLLSNRIRRRLRETAIDTFDEYYRRLVGGQLPGELEQFIDVVTTNETFFFRTASHFEWFAGPFLDDLVSRADAGMHPRSLRVWSAACSTGEEPYSLAICVAEQATRLSGWPISILGTDISESVLSVARKATYGERSLEHVDALRRSRHFTAGADGTTWTVKPSLTKWCEFRRHNLLEPARGGPFDCIFIRNVMIYFDRDSKQKAVGHLVDALAPGGALVVGPADGIYDLLGALEKRSIFIYRKP